MAKRAGQNKFKWRNRCGYHWLERSAFCCCVCSHLELGSARLDNRCHQLDWCPTGDLTMTAIAGVSSTASENKVYIVNRGTGRGSRQRNGMEKIRVVRNGNGYTATCRHCRNHILWKSTSQDATYAFQYVRLHHGRSYRWTCCGRFGTFLWTGFGNSTNFGSGQVPYYLRTWSFRTLTGVQSVRVNINQGVWCLCRSRPHWSWFRNSDSN